MCKSSLCWETYLVGENCNIFLSKKRFSLIEKLTYSSEKCVLREGVSEIDKLLT